MNKQDILDYVKHTPHNTNIAVLSTMLDSYKESVEISSLDDYINLPADSEGKEVYLTLGKQDFENGANFPNKYQNNPNPPKLHLTLKDCNFSSADKMKKQLYLTNCQELVLENCVFEGNTVSDYGLDVNLCTINNAVIKIINCTFNNTGVKSAISIKQRRGATDHPDDITTIVPATIKEVLISGCNFSNNVVDMKVGTSPKGEDVEANTSTGSYPLRIENNKTDMKIQLTYLAAKDEVPEEITIKAGQTYTK